MRKGAAWILCLLAFCLAGCNRQSDCGDSIPSNKMPYTLRDRGTNYELLGHESIWTRIRVEDQSFAARRYAYEEIKGKFTNDHELTAYIEKREKSLEKTFTNGNSESKLLQQFQKDLLASGGEAYVYQLKYAKPVPLNGDTNELAESELGILILSHGRVIKTISEMYNMQH